MFLLLAGVVAVWLDHRYAAQKCKNKVESEQKTRLPDIRKYHKKSFTVINVIDGDTFDINTPDGKYDSTRIRLWGIDTPETKNPDTGLMYFGQEAAGFTKQQVLGKRIKIYLDEQNRTRGYYGRLLAYTELPDGSILNEVLLQQGFAYAELRFRHSFYNKYLRLESLARAQKKGLWEKVTRRQLPQWLQRQKPEFLLKK